MSQIRILNENLANQIAAGEVVERPASVVKELVENALDAGASQISVQVTGAGTRLLRVIDNGCGMDPDDALLCLERHATSKLRSVDDLIHLQTLGFRGEAIPSIASVSKLTLTSRPAGATLGCRVEVRFGSVLKVHEMGCTHGTVIEVADLFANVPARRKFLKSATTELAHIDEVIRSYALVSVQTGFTYQVDGREIIDLPTGEDSTERRIKQVLGDCVNLIPIISDAQAARADIQVSGYLLPPDQTSGRAGRLWTFVNGRYVKDRMVNHAVAEGLQGFLMKGGRPAGVLYLCLPPEGVDVNVHPTKQEVRFSENNLVHNKIVAAVWQSMEAYQEHLKGQAFGFSKPSISPVAPLVSGSKMWALAGNSPCLEVREPQSLPMTEGMPLLPLREEQARPSSLPNSGSSYQTESQGASRLSSEAAQPTITTRDLALSMSMPPEPLPARYLGQLFDTYLLCQVEDGLVAIDQHAAQERLIFEELKRHYDSSSMPSQLLMFPEMVELTPVEVQALEHYGQEMSRLGLELQDFGGDTVLIKAVPAGLSHLPPTEVLHGILSRFIDEQLPAQGGARLTEVLASMACKAAIKAGHDLSPLEAKHLLDRMRETGIFSHCPHGRPVFKRFSRYDIERWFQRV